MSTKKGDTYMTAYKRISQYLAVILLSAFMAFVYSILIFPNSFAPAGIDGICTIIQDVTDISMGYLSLIVNIPLVLLSCIYLNRDFATKTAIYIFTFSTVLIILKNTDISFLQYHTNNGTSTVLSPIAAGALRGVVYAFSINMNASSGGVDIVASLIKRVKPHMNFMAVIFAINMSVALSSYFVYGFKLEPVICSIIYSFVCSATSNSIRHYRTETVKFEIITSDIQTIIGEISSKLHQRATIMDARGAYSGTDKKLILCVADKQSAADIEKFLASKEDTIYFKSVVNNGIL